MVEQKKEETVAKQPEFKQGNCAEIIALWGIQETILQQYRSIFIMTQSVIIGIALLTTQVKHPLVPMCILCVLAAYTMYLWQSICKRRGTIVYVCQFLAEQAENIVVKHPVKIIKNFDDDDKMEDVKIGEKLFSEYRSHHKNKTRKKMQNIMPWVFIAAWVFLLSETFFKDGLITLTRR